MSKENQWRKWWAENREVYPATLTFKAVWDAAWFAAKEASGKKKAKKK